MNLFLLVVTGISLAVALVASIVAWRSVQSERARSAARVAALRAAASDVPGVPGASWSTPQQSTVRPTLHEAAASRTAPEGRPWAAPILAAPPAPAPSAPGLFAPQVAAVPGETQQRTLAVAALLLLVVFAGGGYWAFGGDSAPSAGTTAAAPAPLELISLTHSRRGAHLSIAGTVRNPHAGAPIERLAAVVMLSDPQGTPVTSASAEVDFTALAPGDESPFVISLDAPASVARYRVSFRNEAGIVPHIDRRGQDPIARGTS